MAWVHFLEALPAVSEALEIISGEKNQDEDIEHPVAPWDNNTRGRARCLLKSIRDPMFVCGLVCLDTFMSPILLPTQLLQGRDIEVIQAYTIIDDVIQGGIYRIKNFQDLNLIILSFSTGKNN